MESIDLAFSEGFSETKQVRDVKMGLFLRKNFLLRCWG